MMPVRLSVCLSVTFVHCGHRVRWIPDIFACLDRWMSLLLTDNAWPGSSDGMMPGFLVEEGEYGKSGNCSDIAILLIFLLMDSNHMTYYRGYFPWPYVFPVGVWRLLIGWVTLASRTSENQLQRTHAQCSLPCYRQGFFQEIQEKLQNLFLPSILGVSDSRWTCIWMFSVISVENAFCQKTVRLITTSA